MQSASGPIPIGKEQEQDTAMHLFFIICILVEGWHEFNFTCKISSDVLFLFICGIAARFS